MNIFQKIQKKIKSSSENNREIAKNIVGAFIIRGGALLVSLFTMPVYIRFFETQTILGIWYTILSVLSWVLTFDLGLGNGLRNKLPECLVHDDKNQAKKYIASTYVGTFGIVFIWAIVGTILISSIDWNSLLNIKAHYVARETLITCVRIVFLGILLQFILKLITSILYALQKSAVVNFLTLITSILTLAMVSLAPHGDMKENLIRMSVINVIAENIPYLIATIVVFSRELRCFLPKAKDVSLKCVKEVLNIGIVLLWLQLVFMVISSTNEVLISHLSSAASVVEYQAYNKIFSTISSLFSLALIPIWSAVTKAAAQKKFDWIEKLTHYLLMATGGIMLCEFMVVPLLQFILDIWLGKGYIAVHANIAVIFVISNTIFFLHNVNTSLGNGMSFFKVQIIWMTFAAAVDIPLAWLFVNLMNSWVGVILANIISLLPFEIIEIIAFYRYINEKRQKAKLNSED